MNGQLQIGCFFYVCCSLACFISMPNLMKWFRKTFYKRNFCGSLDYRGYSSYVHSFSLMFCTFYNHYTINIPRYLICVINIHVIKFEEDGGLQSVKAGIWNEWMSMIWEVNLNEMMMMMMMLETSVMIRAGKMWMKVACPHGLLYFVSSFSWSERTDIEKARLHREHS